MRTVATSGSMAIWWGCAQKDEAGLSDRLAILQWLLDMGTLLNGSSCLCGGVQSARALLNPGHSRDTAESWSAYLDTSANNGQPWQPCRSTPEQSCKQIHNPGEMDDWWQLWKHGDAICRKRCISLRFSPWLIPLNSSLGLDFTDTGTHGLQALLRTRNQSPAFIPPSSAVVDAAHQILTSRQLWHSGVIHVRRGDKLSGNARLAECTNPETVVSLLQQRWPQKWIVLLYFAADDDYQAQLSEANTRMRTNLSLYFEPELSLTLADNYMNYAIGKYLMAGAKERGVCIDLRFCRVDCRAFW